MSTLNDQETGLGHCCQTAVFCGSEGPFSCAFPAVASELQIPETSLAYRLTGHASPGGFHTYDPVVHSDPSPATDGAEFSVPSSSIPDTLSTGNVGQGG